MASLLELSGLGWAVPDFNTLSRRQKTLEVVIPFRGSKGPLHLLVDSTGIKVEGEGEWHTRKHGGSKRRARHGPRTSGGHGSRRKIHLGIDEETLEIRAVEVTSSNVGDVEPVNATGSNEPGGMLPDLLAQIPANEEIATVTADGACDTRACHDAIAARSAAARPAADVTGLRPPGCRGPDPRGGHEPLRGNRHPGHCGNGISVSGERGTADAS